MAFFDDLKNAFMSGFNKGSEAVKGQSSGAAQSGGSAKVTNANLGRNTAGQSKQNNYIIPQATVNVGSQPKQSEYNGPKATITLNEQQTNLLNRAMAGEDILQTFYRPTPTADASKLAGTRRGALAYIDSVYRYDQAQGNQLYAQYMQGTLDPSSAYYAPYSQPTNRAIQALKELGVNVDNIDDKWFADNAYLKDYYVYTANTNNLSTTMTNKRSTPIQKAAYYYHQLDMERENTKQALAEVDAAKKEIAYWVGRTDLNLSPEQIIQKLDISGNSKYKTLAKMDSSRGLGTPMELNAAINYNGEDDLYTWIWQAMNNGGSGDYQADAISCAYGYGNVWKDDPDIQAKYARNRYSVGMVDMDDAGQYFGQQSFTWDWYNQNYDENNTDPTYVKMMGKVYEALDNSEKAKEQKAELDKYIERQLPKIETDKDVERVLRDIDWSDKGILVAIDKSLGKDGRKGNGKWVSTAEAIDYCYQDIVDRLNAAKEENSSKLNGDDTIDSFIPPDREEQSTNASLDTTGEDQGYKYKAPDWDQEVVIPSVIDGKKVSEKEAIEHYKNTGELLNGPESADEPLNPQVMGGVPEDKPVLSEEAVGRQEEIRKEAQALASREAFASGEANYENIEDEELLRNAYDSKHGEGSYDQAMTDAASAGAEEAAAPESTGTKGKFSAADLPIIASSTPGVKPTQGARTKAAKTGTQLTEETLNAKVKDTVNALEGSLTDGERTHFENIPGVEYGRVVLEMKKGPLNPALWQDEWFKEYNCRKSEESANKTYIDTAFGSMDIRHNYERTEKELKNMQDAVDKNLEKYGEQVYAVEEFPEVIHITLSNGMLVEYSFNHNTKEYEEEYDPAVGDYEERLSRQIGPADYYNPEDYNVEKYRAEIAEKLPQYTENAIRILNAKEKYGEEKPEDMLTISEMEAMRDQIDIDQKWLTDNQGDYNRALFDLTDARNHQSSIGEMMLRNGFDIVDPRYIDGMLDAAESFLDWQTPQETGTNILNELWMKPISTEECQATIKQIDDVLKEDETIQSYFGELPDVCNAQIDSHKAYLGKVKQLYQYYAFSQDEKFHQYAEAGREIAAEYVNANTEGDGRPKGLGTTKMYFAKMDKNEKEMYYALLGRDGVEAADAYYDLIDPTLFARMEETAGDVAAENAQSGVLGRLKNIFFAGLMGPLEVFGSAMDLVTTAVTGRGNKWMRAPTKISQRIYSETQNEVANVYKDDEAKGWLVSKFYDAAYNNWRSATSSLVFSPFVPAGAPEGASAIGIALVAGDEAYQEAIDNDMEPWRAATIGAVNFFSEWVTEGIKIKWLDKLADGGSVTESSVKKFVKGLIPEYVQEALGEEITFGVEKSADILIGRDKGETAERLDYYKNTLHYSDKEAEDMIKSDLIAEAWNTAFTTAFSTLLGGVGAAYGQLKTYGHYAKVAASDRLSGRNPKATIRSVMNGDIAIIRSEEQARKAWENREPGKFNFGEQKVNGPDITDSGFSEAGKQANMDQYDIELNVLEGVSNSTPEAQTETLGAVLEVDDADSNRAGAAASLLRSIFGDKTIDKVQQLLAGGLTGNININILKKGIQMAAMADGRCRNIMTSDAFQRADPETQARWLAEAVAEDAQNQNVQSQVNDATHEFRVAEEEKRLMSEGAGDAAVTAKENIQAAKEETEAARDELEKRSDDVEAKQEAAKVAGEEAANNPTDDNVNEAVKTTEELKKSVESEDQYQQHLDKTERQEKETTAKEQRTIDETAASIRQQAETTVRQQEQAEAQAAAEAQARVEAEQQRLAEEMAQRQAEQDALSGKTAEEIRHQQIDQEIERMGLKGEQAEAVRQQLYKYDQDKALGNIDTSKHLDDAEATLAIGALSRRLGVQIEVGTMPEGKNGSYKNGKITLSDRLTVGQAMLEVALHEITHSLEKTKSYAKYKDVVLSTLYSTPEARARAIQDKIDSYKKQGVILTPEGAEAELVANFAKDTKRFANRQTIDRMLDAGLGGKIRNTLHNINQYLKNIHLEGEERAQAEGLRKAEQLYIKAINERRNINTHPNSEQFSVNQFAQAAGLFYNDTQIRDKNGNLIADVGLYTTDPSVAGSNAQRIETVTPEMMADTPVGKLTNAALALGTMNRETVGKIHKMFADLMTMCTNLPDTNLVWEIAGSTLYSEFSAIKSNSDKQYSTTVDFGTICTKTQAVINQLSRDMLKIGRGLTSQEILQVYNDVFNADLKVPCPVCYVFSRWLGVPSLLENIRQYQNRFLGEEGADVDPEETQRRVDSFIRHAHQEYGIDKNFEENLQKAREKASDKLRRVTIKIAQTEAKIAKYQDQLAVKPNGNTTRNLASAQRKLAGFQTDLENAQSDFKNADVAAYTKAINKKKADIEKKIKEKDIKIQGDDKGHRGIDDDIRDAIKAGKPYDNLTAQKEKLYGEIDALRAQLREVDAYNWVTQALCKMDNSGKFVIDPEFKRTKNEILLDLNRTGEFAKDVKNWTYRSTRGAGMGKAILPYSGATIGDSVLGVAARTMANPFLDHDDEGALAALKKKVASVKQQNLIGGQRFQSTSDYRPEWGLDYIMTFIEQQALGSNGQLYTKVSEAVPMYASAGIDVNCSLMPYSNGYHEASAEEIAKLTPRERRSRLFTENGKTYLLDFSDVTGMDYNTARLLSESFDSVQMIMVGINDIHIRACLGSEEIDFVIPWHASGNTKGQLQNMMATVREKLTNSSDYTKTQTDSIMDKEGLKTAHGKVERGEALTEHEADLIHKEEMREARIRLLTGATLTATDKERISESEYLTSLYERFMGETIEGKPLPHDPDYWVDESTRVKMTTGQAEQIFPYEYWDTSLTKAEADENGRRFIRYCQELGMIPRFSGANQKNDDGTISRFGNFSGAVYDEDTGEIIGFDEEKMAKGYWKTLIDRKMYDNQGNYRKQNKIDASNINAGSLMRGEDGRMHHVQSNIPDQTSGATYSGEEAETKYRKADEAFYQRNKPEVDAYQESKTNANAVISEQYDLAGDINPNMEMTEGEMMQMLRDAGIDYDDAVARGDMERAAQDVESYAASKGYTDEAFHGTNRFGFTEFDLDRSQGTIFVAHNKDTAKTYASPYAKVRPIYDNSVERVSYNPENPDALVDIVETERAKYFDGHSYYNIKNAQTIQRDELQNIIDGAKETFMSSMSDGDLDKKVYNTRNRESIDDIEYYLKDIADSFRSVGGSETAREYFSRVFDAIANSNSEKLNDKEFIRDLSNAIYVLRNLVSSTNYIGNWKLTEAISALVSGNALMATGNEHFYEIEHNGYAIGVQSFVTGETLANAINDTRAHVDPSIYHLYVRPGNQLVVDADGADWHSIRVNWTDELLKTREIAEYAKANGYSSVRINNVYDSGGADPDQNGYGDISIFFNKEDVKSADTVTYDDDGNMIPLEERFTDNPDIRWDAGQDTSSLTEGEMEQILRDAGITDRQIKTLNRRNGPNSPAQTGNGTRQFGSDHGMLQESDELDQAAIQYVMTNDKYNTDTNQEQIERAIEWIRKNKSEGDQDGFRTSLQKVTRSGFNFRSADGQAKMVAVMGMAVAKGDVYAQVLLADSFNKQGTVLGQALQARKLFRLMTPEGRISTLQKMLNDNQDMLDAKGADVDLKFSDWIYRAAAVATEDGDFQKVQEAAAEELSEQLPASWKDKLRAWRMLSMLGNPRTHIRNIVGNALFIPAVSIKNKLGAVAEIVSRQDTRTKTLAPILSKEIRDFARQDAIAMKDDLTGEAKYKENPKVQAEPFHGLMKVLSDFNSNMLEGEDWFFLKGHYRRALGGWMQANGYTAEQLRNDPALLEQGRAYAIDEAQKATYRDFNGLAAKLNEITRNPKTTGQKALAFGVEAVQPFKKTPANILKRVEYSPVGIARSLTTDIYHLKQYLDYQKGKLKAMPEKAISPTQFIDRLCSGLTGTGIMAMGAILANMGIVTCGLDDDDDEFEKIKGNQKYAIKFNLLGQDVTFTMDWAAPMSMPFFVGAAIQNMSKDEKGFSIDALVNAFGNITEPVFNLSMLDGVNSLLQVSHSDDSTLTQIGAKILTNYATSYIPSIVGAIARTIDENSRKAYVESGKASGIMGTFRYAREQTENKIPGLSQTNIPVRDVWGNIKTSDLTERLLENFVLPGYVEHYKEDPVTNEMAALYEQTGAKEVIPKDPAKTFSAGGQKYILSAEQWDQYKTVRGQTAYEGLTALIQTDEYKDATADAKIKMVEAVWDYANEKGKLAVDPGNKTQRITVNYSEMDKALDVGDYEAYETMIEALHQDGVEDSSIKTRIGNKYRDKYKDAYRSGNYDRMYEIEDILDASGFSFKTSDWEKAVDKEQD